MLSIRRQPDPANCRTVNLPACSALRYLSLEIFPECLPINFAPLNKGHLR
jgi:hypothetical protein